MRLTTTEFRILHSAFRILHSPMTRLHRTLLLSLSLGLALAGLATVVAFGHSAAASGRPQPPGRGPQPPPAQPAFYWTQPTDAPPALAQAPPQLPDLSIQWIERAPRYPRYCLDYSRGLPELCPGSEDARHVPSPGEIVTFTAHIANQGVLTSPAASALWTVGQAAQLPDDLPALAPGMTATLAITWPWPAEPLTMTLSIDPAGALEEVTRRNDALSQRSDALYLDIAVHPLVYAAFNRRSNLAGSWSFPDWIQAQFEAMNANLAAATYPAAPRGVLDRVRIDRIVVSEALGGDAVTSTLAFDGRWTFRVDEDDPDTPEDEGALSAEAYARAFANTVDWGLAHELSHQLGVIDLYQLNVFGSFQNELLEADGLPSLLGFLWPNPGLMGGGDRGGHPPNSYSEHTALALNRNAGLRRGYYGEYLYDLPPRNSLLVLDNRGQPLPGAQVALFQTEGGALRAEPVISGALDAEGRFVLPARPVPLGGLTTATGHTLAPNPFGPIDVVGFNGQLLVQVSQDEQRFYAWWPITDFNLASWQGVTAYERTLATHLPPAGAPQPPPALQGRVDGSNVTLHWLPSPGITAYRIYRGEEPEFYPFALVGVTDQLSFADVSWRTARYAVTAVDGQGRESGFSPLLRAQRTVDPVGAAVDPVSGRRTILDRHDGALITQLADDRWVGRQGSVHIGLTGSQALASNAQGQLLIPVTSEDRLVILNGEREVLYWFGRERFVTGTLEAPSGVLQAGEPFTVTQRPVSDASTLGLASFDWTWTLSGERPLLASGVERAPGRWGDGVQIGPGDRLIYGADDHLDTAAGSVQLWVQPHWPWNDGQEHVFVEVGSLSQAQPTQASSPAYRLRLAKADWNGLYAWLRDGTHDIALYAGIEAWLPGQWRHLAVAWQTVQPGLDYRRYTLWVDGVLRDSRVLRRPVAGPFDSLSLGSGLDGRHPAEATLDELHLSSLARVGNSQQVSLIVSQSRAQRLDVFDWLGNRISQFGGPGVGPGQFDWPRELAQIGERIVVADAGNDRLQVLALQGGQLSWQADWRAGLLHPQGLAALPDGRLLVSDRGDNQVKLLDADGRLLRRWAGPNDGHPGNFWQPAGLAVLPGGDILVADAGNGRLVRISGDMAPARLYLPLIGIHA